MTHEPHFTISVSPGEGNLVQPGDTVINSFTLTRHHEAGPFHVEAASNSLDAVLSFSLDGGSTWTDLPTLQDDLRHEATRHSATIEVKYTVAQPPAPALPLFNGQAIVTELVASLVDPRERVTHITAVAIDTALINPAFGFAGVGNKLPNSSQTGTNPGQSTTDVFTLTNTTAPAAPGRFSLTGDAMIYGLDPSLPNAYTYSVTIGLTTTQSITSYKTVNQLLTGGPALVGQSIQIAVVYTGPDAMKGQFVVTQLSATFTPDDPAQPGNAANASAAQTVTTVDAVVPVPKLYVQPPTVGQIVTPGMSFTDRFQITNLSGQAAKITIASIALALDGTPYGVSQYTAFALALNGKPVTIEKSSTPFAALQQAVDGLSALAPGADSVTIDATYNVPEGALNAKLTDTLTAYATAGGTDNSGTPNSGLVTNLLGDYGAVLDSLVASLDLDLKMVKTLSDDDIENALDQADADVAAFVNGAGSMKVNSGVFAKALAVHDLSNILSSIEIERLQTPAPVDVVP